MWVQHSIYKTWFSFHPPTHIIQHAQDNCFIKYLLFHPHWKCDSFCGEVVLTTTSLLRAPSEKDSFEQKTFYVLLTIRFFSMELIFSVRSGLHRTGANLPWNWPPTFFYSSCSRSRSSQNRQTWVCRPADTAPASGSGPDCTSTVQTKASGAIGAAQLVTKAMMSQHNPADYEAIPFTVYIAKLAFM